MLGLFKKKEKAVSGRNKRLKIRVKEVIKETQDATTLVFEPSHPIDYLAGQYITLIFDIDGKEERRSYSLSSCPKTDLLPAITVKRVDDGKVSNYLNDHMKVDDEFEILAPGGSFTPDYTDKENKEYVLFAGGSGITPLFSILKSILAQDPNLRINLIYQNRDEANIIFKDKLERLEANNSDTLKIHHVLSRPDGNWTGLKGRLSGEMVKSLLLDLPEFRIQKAHYFVCGPSGMMDVVESALEELNVPQSNIFTEKFVASEDKNTNKSTDEKTELVERTVTIHLDGERHEVVVPANKSILEAALDENIDMPFSCQSGLCTACRGKLLKGKIYMEEDEGLSDEEIADGYVLNCVGHPLTADVEIEIE
jgi:ring-1,2-phenylacetyl-CoA epoxidase subunit PaaE